MTQDNQKANCKGSLAEQYGTKISERANAGPERARLMGARNGRAIGRPKVIFPRDRVAVLRGEGLSWREIASRLGVSIGSVRRAFQPTSDEPQPCQNPMAGIL